MKSILVEAAELVDDGDRNRDYGHPRENFADIAGMWNIYLRGKSTISPRDVAMMMVLLKVARDAKTPKRDNLVDGAGYFRTADRLDEPAVVVTDWGPLNEAAKKAGGTK